MAYLDYESLHRDIREAQLKHGTVHLAVTNEWYDLAIKSSGRNYGKPALAKYYGLELVIDDYEVTDPSGVEIRIGPPVWDNPTPRSYKSPYPDVVNVDLASHDDYEWNYTLPCRCGVMLCECPTPDTGETDAASSIAEFADVLAGSMSALGLGVTEWYRRLEKSFTSISAIFAGAHEREAERRANIQRKQESRPGVHMIWSPEGPRPHYTGPPPPPTPYRPFRTVNHRPASTPLAHRSGHRS